VICKIYVIAMISIVRNQINPVNQKNHSSDNLSQHEILEWKKLIYNSF